VYRFKSGIDVVEVVDLRKAVFGLLLFVNASVDWVEGPLSVKGGG